MSTAKYPNRDALREAHDIYLDAIYPFISKCLDKFQDATAIEKKVEISDVAHLVRTYWYGYFEEQFKVIDPYYEARSAISLIVEGRNRASHPPWDLDSEFTRTQLFLIAEVLGKINISDAQREVENIRDKLFDDTAEQLVKIAVEAEEAKYEKSVAAVEKRLAAADGKIKKLSNQMLDNAVKLNEKEEELKKEEAEVKEKKEELEKLSERLITAKLSEKENKKQFNSISKQLGKLQAAHSTCKERLTTISNQLASTEAERDDYKEHFETASRELKKAEMKWSMYENSLTAMRNLFVALTIENRGIQKVFPPFGTDSAVRVLDRRGVDKQNYLLNLLEQKQPTIIYVQSEEMVDLLLERVLPEKADLIEKHGEQISETEEMEILKRLENGKLIAVVSDTTLATLAQSHCVEHFVFCHLAPGIDEFFKRCQPAFTSGKNAYLHLIYESERDIKEITKKYPDEPTLRKLYEKFRDCTPTVGKSIKPDDLYSELCKQSELKITELGIETGLSVFEELGFLEQNEEGIRRLEAPSTELAESKIYCRGEKLRKEIENSPDFQYEQSIEQIWKEILKRLDVDNKQIVREGDIHKIPFKVSGIEVDLQLTRGTEKDSITPPTPDVWPQRTLSAFNSLRQRASKNFHDPSNLTRPIDDARGYVHSPLLDEPIREEDDWHSPEPEEYDDYKNKYNLAMQFIREHGINAFEQGVALLAEDCGNPDYDFTEDETNMLLAFQDALKNFQTQSERFTEVVEKEVK